MPLSAILAALHSVPPFPRPAGRRIRFRPWSEELDGRCLPSFSPAVNYAVGAAPLAVATGYVNNDAALDLVTANSGNDTVSVQLGNGAGGFSAAVAYPAGTTPVSVAVGDFTGDGKVDIATVNQGSADVTVLVGNGDGTFQPPVSTSFGEDQPLSLAAGDFNADGTMDLAVSVAHPYSYYYYYGPYYSSYGEVGVLIGNGQGGFDNPGGMVYTGGYLYDLAVADLNGDTKLDVAATDGWGYLDVLFGDGSGGLSFGTNAYTGSYPNAVAVGDFTGDGKLDLVAVGQTIDVLPGTGTGSFGSRITTSSGPDGMTDLAAADFNGDGRLDVVTSDQFAGTVRAFLGIGDGTFLAPLDHPVGTNPAALVVGTFNADGRPDVAAANYGSDAVSVLLNDGTWPVATPGIRIGDVTVTEGNTGSVEAKFVVTLSAPSTVPVTVQYATVTGTATAGADFQTGGATLTFAPNVTSLTVSVPVLGDRVAENTETFTVVLSNATNAGIYDDQGVGTIVDNEPRLSINNISKAEGNGKATNFVFTITLSAAYDQAVTVNFATASGTATAGSDYTAKSGTVTFAPGERTKTITISVICDKKRESNETFFVDLSGASSNALIGTPRGVGTILNDDKH